MSPSVGRGSLPSRDIPRVATSEDVAAQAGVSQSSVSLVMSGKAAGRVSVKTAERIRAVAAELGYEPNSAAAALKTGRANVVALAVPTIAQPYFASVLLGAEKSARDRGYAVVLLNSDSALPWSRRLTAMIRGRQLDGAIVYAPTAEEIRDLAVEDLPLVFVDANLPGQPALGPDVEHGMVLAADHLLSLGHRNIGYLSVDSGRETYSRRAAAFRQRLGEVGITIPAAADRACSLDLTQAEEAARQLLIRNPDLTAVACADDLLAAAVLRAAHTLGIAVPAQLSVIGFGGIDLARLLTPELTTIALPAEAVGALAMDTLLGVIGTRLKPSAETAEVLTPILEVRASTGPLIRG